jgi:sigma-E factor negative regulatory protein RseA
MTPATSSQASTSQPGAAGAEAERLSAWLDGEIDSSQGQALLGRLLKEDAWRRQYEDWCMVGDALRSQEVIVQHSPRLCARVARALADEPALLAPRATASGFKRNLASGAAVAAAAAVLVLVAVPQMRRSAAVTEMAGSAVPASSALVEPVRAVGPEGSLALVRRNPRLDPYIEAHQEVTGPGVMPAAAVYLRFGGGEGER